MNKALHSLNSDGADRNASSAAQPGLDWRRSISDHIAYALLVYTGLQIYVTMAALKNDSASVVPYFALIVLVAAIIPGCRMFERHWEGLSDEQAADPALAPRFRRDRMMVWIAAIGLPFVITGFLKGMDLLF